MSQGSRAEDLFNQANKTLHGGFFSFLSSSNRFEDAAELFEKSGNLFKANSDDIAAIRAFEGAYNAHLKAKSNYYASLAACEVGNSYSRLDDAENTEKWILEATKLVEDSRLNQAAKNYKFLAEFFENLKNLDKAFFYFEKAEKYFTLEKSDSSEARNCQIKMATISAEKNQFENSKKLFVKIAKNCLKNNLLQFSAKDYFLRAILVDLAAGNLKDAQTDEEIALKSDPRFTNSREAKFVRNLILSFEEKNVKKLQETIFEFDQVQSLDFWKVKMLNFAKEKIETKEDMDLITNEDNTAKDDFIL